MSLRDYVNASNTGFQFPILEIGNGGFIDYNDFKIRIGQLAATRGKHRNGSVFRCYW